MTSQWHHKAAILNFEAAILNLEPGSQNNHKKVKDYPLFTNEGEKTEKRLKKARK